MKSFFAPQGKRIRGLQTGLRTGLGVFFGAAVMISSVNAAGVGPYAAGIENKTVGAQFKISDFNSVLDVTRKLWVDERGAGIADDLVGLGTFVNPVLGACPDGAYHLDIDDDTVVDAGECFQGVSVVDGSVGVGTDAPEERLHLAGAVIVGEHMANPAVAGTIEWDGTNFRGHDGSIWVNLDADNAADVALNTEMIESNTANIALNSAVLQDKVGKVDPVVAGNLAELTADGGLIDSGLKLDDAGITTTDLWSADKIASEIASAVTGVTVPVNLADLQNVTETGLASGDILQWDGAVWVNADVSAWDQDASNDITDDNFATVFGVHFGTKNTDNLTEGLTNLYFTDERAITAIGGELDDLQSTTTNLWSASQIESFVATEVAAGVAGITGGELAFDGWDTDASNDITTDNFATSFNIQLAISTTDNLDEGLTNLYFTDARAITAIGGEINDLGVGTTDIWSADQIASYVSDEIAAGVAGITGLELAFDGWDKDASNDITTDNFAVTFDVQFGTKSTTNLVEGTNLYFTDARAVTAIGGELDDLTTTTTNMWSADKITSYVSDEITAGVAGITGGELAFDGWDKDASDDITTANFGTAFDAYLPTKTTDNLPEGAANFYFTDARAITAVGGELDDSGVTASDLWSASKISAEIAAVALTDGNGTTANGTAVDLGGSGISNGWSWGYDDGESYLNVGWSVNDADRYFDYYIKSVDGNSATRVYNNIGQISMSVEEGTASSGLDLDSSTASLTVDAAGNTGSFTHAGNTVNISAYDLTETSTVALGMAYGEILVSGDNADFGGLKYAADYSENLNFTDRSLVDKGYVDSRVADANQLEERVAANEANISLNSSVIQDTLNELSDDGVEVITVTNNAGLIQANLLGGVVIKRVAVYDQDYTAKADDYFIAFTHLTADRTVNLPASVCEPGRLISIKDETGLAEIYNIILDPEGAATVDGLPTFVMESGYNSIELYCNGTNWFIK